MSDDTNPTKDITIRNLSESSYAKLIKIQKVLEVHSGDKVNLGYVVSRIIDKAYIRLNIDQFIKNSDKFKELMEE